MKNTQIMHKIAEGSQNAERIPPYQGMVDSESFGCHLDPFPLAGLDSIQKIVEAAGNREDSLEAVDIQPF